MCYARASLVEDILVKLLWEDFVHFPVPKNKERTIPRMSCETSEGRNISLPKTSGDAPILKYQINYSLELGKCIVGVLSGIASVENDLLSVFCSAFQKICRQMLMYSGNGKEPEMVEQLIEFLSILEQDAVRKGETWPLVYVLGPTLAENFSSVESIVSLVHVLLIHLFNTTKVLKTVFLKAKCLREVLFVVKNIINYMWKSYFNVLLKVDLPNKSFDSWYLSFMCFLSCSFRMHHME